MSAITKMSALAFIFLTLWSSLLCSIPSDEQETLKDIIDSLTNLPSDWTINDLGNGCTWEGIGCSLQDSVTNLSLSSRNIKGQLPDSLLKLKSLSVLDFHQNLLDGTLPSLPNTLQTILKVKLLNVERNKVLRD
eukprot:TRINITY_DN4331_c0_g1_i5.p1 TRINITY_DN4331_c0_g1~~TRINITY_DN4331_c0_g1_i5.p1  ORF type:complete len:144 (+),score=30.80 TRINITY_DN4331_c0_g1_i5:32-433(+)